MKRAGSFVRRSTASKRIQDNLVRVRRDLETSRGDHRLEFVDVPSRFEFGVTRRRRILPKVCEVQSLRVEILFMAAVVFDITATVATCGNGQSHMVKRLGLTFCEVKQRVMGGIQFSPARKSALHRERDPVSKHHSFVFEK